jgi:hypothetical protein
VIELDEKEEDTISLVKIGAIEEQKQEAQASDSISLTDMTKPVLVQFAKDKLKLELDQSMKKEDLISAITEAMAKQP